MSFSWNGTDQAMLRRMAAYERAVQRAVRQVADYFAPILENYAKDRALWTDRTANARQGLHTYVEELAGDVVQLYLSHGMDYGLWLEVKSPSQPVNIPGVERTMAGKYAIILPTIMAHFDEVMQMLEDIFK